MAKQSRATKQDTYNVNLRGISKELSQQLKIAAAVHGKSMGEFCINALREHVNELERKGTIPKAK